MPQALLEPRFECRLIETIAPAFAVASDVPWATIDTMDGEDGILSELKRIASSMQARSRKEGDDRFFDAMTEAIVWRDELPEPRAAHNCWCLRPLFRYRASVALGEPDRTAQRYWLNSRELFPNWVGFRPERTFLEPELLAFLRDNIRRVAREAERLCSEA